MKKKWQFQKLALQEYIAELPTTIQPSIILPVRRELPVPMTPPLLFTDEQETATIMDLSESVEAFPPVPAAVSRKKKLLRSIALILTLILGLTIYFTWRSASATAAPPAVQQQNYGNAASTSSDTASTDNGAIVVYILGAITNPGVYRLSADARVYQLVQAAGGLLPSANAVALNMAAKLTDGEEIYVLAVGEIAPPGTNLPAGSNNGPPGSLTPGQLVNINTATEEQMVQALHISATTANKIIAYRTQHGPYTSVSQLLLVMSKSIYDRIKSMVTV